LYAISKCVMIHRLCLRTHRLHLSRKAAGFSRPDDL
jgi:hypothetical protein